MNAQEQSRPRRSSNSPQWPRGGGAAGLILGAQTLLALLAARGQFDAYLKAPDSVYSLLLLVSLALLMGATLIVPIRFARRVAVYVRRKRTTHLICRRARKADFRQLHAFWAKHFGDATPSISQMNAWHARNANIFWIIEQVNPLQNSRRLVGSFKVIPLTRDAVAELLREALNGSRFRPEHITRHHFRASGWYIGDVVAEGTSAKGRLLKELEEFFSRSYRAGVPVFTRPLTGHGLRMVDLYEFAAVSPTAQGALGRIYQKQELHARHVPPRRGRRILSWIIDRVRGLFRRSVQSQVLTSSRANWGAAVAGMHTDLLDR